MKILLSMSILCILSSFLYADAYSAEDITKVQNVTYNRAQNGDIVAQYLLNKEGFIEWRVEVEHKHMYALDFVYALYAENPSAVWLFIDGKRVHQIDLNTTGSTAIFKQSISLYKRLDKGTHTVRIVHQASTYDLGIKMFHLSSSEVKEETPDSIESTQETPAESNASDIEDIPLNAPAVGEPVPVIIDTDMMTDCDDAAAIGVAHALEDNGEIKILGMMLSAHDYTQHNGNTVSAINYYYNHNYDIPIGAWGELIANHGQITTNMKKKFRFDNTPNTSMHSLVKQRHTNDNIVNYRRKNSLDLYRTLLSQAADHSVKIVIIGASFNIARLLKYEKALVSKKVKEIIFSAWIESCNQNMCVNGGESRSEGKRATDYIFEHLPSNVLLTVSGDEANDRTDLYVGQAYRGTNTPMETTYSVAYHGLQYGRPYVDQIALLVAARGASSQYFKVKNNGHFESKFSTKERGYWRSNYNKNHRKLEYDETRRARLKSLINTLMMQKPKRKSSKHTINPIALNTTVNGRWRSSIASTHRKGRYARYYTFTLSQTTKVTIDLKSSVDTYLYLLKHKDKKGAIITKDDDGGEKRNSKIVKTLPAGTYTIEATTYIYFRKGTFSVRVSTKDIQMKKTRYDFNQHNHTEGWTYLRMQQQFGGPYNGVWYLSVNNDPQLMSPALQVNAQHIKKIQIKIANDHNPQQYSTLQVFWKRSDQNFYSEAKSKMIPIASNGGWFTYTIDLSHHPEWKGNITKIRIDPILVGDGHWIAIDYIYFKA